ncbi:hypothetical protein JL09_g5870 [Pichia kudriavzevii]|uniref:Uncharacterized protein n=1 Tax=Pichia kudriavzevii TaxID=4909 RepID=A0A099NSY6_PICKU|nr:hypothetical protein JL09_g5870 [Pichia kudriavzevii]
MPPHARKIKKPASLYLNKKIYQLMHIQITSTPKNSNRLNNLNGWKNTR